MAERDAAGSRRVLVVDDEDAVREIVADVLAEEGFDVRRARNGREALDLLQEWLPRVILLDLMMPVMDGWTFRAEQRRLAGAAAAVPVIVLSGTRDARSRGADLDAVQVLAKPFDLDDVVAAVEQSL